MKRLLIFLALVNVSSAVLSQADFVTLRGRQFYDGDGQPFYPLVMNYVCMLACNPANKYDYVLANYIKNGPTEEYECSDAATCHQTIIDELTQIKAMGFNMIRPAFTPMWDKDLQQFKLKGYDFGSNPAERDIIVDPDPLHTLNYGNLQNYFSLLEFIADEAWQLGMYTMINGFLGDVTTEPAKTIYLDFLPLLGERFKDNKHIAFYDITNEPYYQYDNHITKQQACEIISDFYDLLKGADEHHHLITAGNLGVEETYVYDVGLMKSDFSQPHFYPLYPNYDYSYDHYLDRVKGRLYWMNRNCPLPWIQGEVSFRAADGYSVPVNLGEEAKVDGSLTDQENFVTASLAAARDCDASGYVWWDYQDGNYPDPIDGFGLIKMHAGYPYPNAGDIKPAADVFANYLDPLTHQPPDPVSHACVEPDYYRDPFHHADFNTTLQNAVSGRVEWPDGSSVDDAVIEGLNWLDTDDNGTFQYPLDDKFFHSWIYTYSDGASMGSNFTIIPYSIIHPADPKIIYIRGSATGASRFDYPPNQWPWTDVQINTTPPTFTITKVGMQYDETVSDINVPTGNTENFKGRNSLTVKGTSIVEGSSDLTARNEINVTENFHATPDDEVHIFTSETFTDCDAYSGFARFAGPGSASEDNGSGDGMIELQFKQSQIAKADIEVVPNPSSGIFSVLKSKNGTYGEGMILRNIIGQEIGHFNCKENKIVLDLSYLAKGIYFIETSLDQIPVVKKIIIN